MHNLKKFNMNRKYRVRIRCLTFLVTLFWLPLHAQEGLSNNKMLFSPFFVLREYIFSFQ